ncbi:MAG: SCO6745 family protein, partial [Acidimicrobiales bacterium]
ITATFYGFAHRMVARAIPEVWRHVGVEQSLEIRLDAVDRAWRRIFATAGAGLSHTDAVAEAATMARDAIEGVESGARPLYAGHTALPWPNAPYLQLWHACTLLREHRGDSHTIALAAAEIDPVQCQVLMAARGHGNKATLLKIRGWNDQEWDTAVAALVERGWLQPDGTMTEAGRAARRAVEDHTDRLAAEPAHRLGAPGVARLTELLTPVHQHLFTVGEIPGQWPPPHVVKGEEPAR